MLPEVMMILFWFDREERERVVVCVLCVGGDDSYMVMDNTSPVCAGRVKSIEQVTKKRARN